MRRWVLFYSSNWNLSDQFIQKLVDDIATFFGFMLINFMSKNTYSFSFCQNRLSIISSTIILMSTEHMFYDKFLLRMGKYERTTDFSKSHERPRIS